MKKSLGLVLMISACLFIKAQVGINMASPERILHIDGQKNTAPAVPSSYYDDVVITTSGNMGVGTKTPKTRLDLRSDEHLNALGIGGTSQTASAAKAGALRYNSGTQDLSYSNGTVWTHTGT
jgi:hypothetical protein